MVAKTNVTALAMVTGMLLLNAPNNNHNNVPVANSVYMDNEMLLVSFVRIVFIACGKNDAVVNAAAIKPVIVMIFIFNFSIHSSKRTQSNFCLFFVWSFSMPFEHTLEFWHTF